MTSSSNDTTSTSDELSDFPRLVAWKEQGRVVAVDGVRIFVRHTHNFGTAASKKKTQKPNLVVMHGYPTASIDFEKIWHTLVSKFEVFAWDYSGYGFSQKVYKTIQEQVDLLMTLLEQEGFCKSNGKQQQEKGDEKRPLVLKTHILSHDLGDTLVQELLARDGDTSCCCKIEIQSIVMLNGGILPQFHRPTFMQWALTTLPGAAWIAPFFVTKLPVFQQSISKVFGPRTKPTLQDIKEWHALILSGQGDAVVIQNLNYMKERQLHHDRWVNAIKDYASNSHNHICLIDGPADPVSGRHLAEAVEEQIPGMKVAYLSHDIGHWPQWEAPDQTIDAFMKFHADIGT